MTDKAKRLKYALQEEADNGTIPPSETAKIIVSTLGITPEMVADLRNQLYDAKENLCNRNKRKSWQKFPEANIVALSALLELAREDKP